MGLFAKKKAKKEEVKVPEKEPEAPEPPKGKDKKVDPRFLIQLHRNGIQDLKKVETEYKSIETTSLYNMNILRSELEKVEKQLLDAGYSETQLIENKDEALKTLDRKNYEFLED